MQNHRQIDVVSKDGTGDCIVLSMVETRNWGTKGANLIDLQKKLHAYLDFIESGEIWSKYAEMKGKKIVIRLHSAFPPTSIEEAFFTRAKAAYLDPLGIAWTTSGLPAVGQPK